ncbi:MAG: hypothetical protein KDC11_14180 [Chitinophagaceae bacterium]|nr:hypothetical protein [Chitinophagaceae bacterium]
MATTKRYILLGLLTCFSLAATSQIQLSENQIKSRLRGSNWTAYSLGIKEWGAIFHKSDSTKWIHADKGLSFKMDMSFAESHNHCGRKPYTGKWQVSNDTIYVRKVTGELIWAFKVLELNNNKLIIKDATP